MEIMEVSGGYDPIHLGHMAYKSARKMGGKLVSALNSYEWLTNKKGMLFMPFTEHEIIIKNLTMVDGVINFEDEEIGSCIKALEKIKINYPGNEMLFCNFGNRKKENCPEMELDVIEFIYGVGVENKENSSSWILKEWKYSSEEDIERLRFYENN